MLFAEALDAPDDATASALLQRLGDVALFVAGFLAGSFARRSVDIDYHIAMGGRAYGALAQAPYHAGATRARRPSSRNSRTSSSRSSMP